MPSIKPSPTNKMRVGISGCLLGQRIRFDGQHKKDGFLLNLMGPHVDWVSMCPEVESGMTIPREPIRLIERNKKIRVVTVKSNEDVTSQLESYTKNKVRTLKALDLTGFILKKGSPSCGMERVKCYDKNSIPVSTTQGVFARELMKIYPELPVEEEGRLRDDRLRENFIERVFAYHRLKTFFAGNWKAAALVNFHARHKMQLLSHSPAIYRELGQLVANSKKVSRAQLRSDYCTLFMEALSKQATPGRNTNTLEHMAGYLKKLESMERKELSGVIQDYRRGWVPLIVPITLLAHYVRKFEIEYLLGQTYLEPNPRELMLRNHV